MNNYGLGGIFQVGDRWHARYSQHGRQIRESTGIRVGPDGPDGPLFLASRNKAQKFLDDKRAEVRSGELTPGQERLTVDQMLDNFLSACRIEGRRSTASTATVLRHVRDFFRGYRAVHVTAPKLRQYIERRTEEGAAPASIRRELAHLRTAFTRAVDDKLMNRNRVPDFPTISVDNAKQGFLEPGDFERLHAALPDYLKDIGTFLYQSGWRSNEAKTLTWADVDLGSGEIRLRSVNSKTKKRRTLPLFGPIREVIERRHADRRLDSPWVFARNDGSQIGQISQAWTRAALRVGLGHLTPHDCRRSAIRNLTRAGVGEHVAMSISGHKSRDTFRRYDITTTEDQARAFEQLEDYVAGEIARPSKIVPLARASRTLAKPTGTDG